MFFVLGMCFVFVWGFAVFFYSSARRVPRKLPSLKRSKLDNEMTGDERKTVSFQYVRNFADIFPLKMLDLSMESRR